MTNARLRIFKIGKIWWVTCQTCGHDAQADTYQGVLDEAAAMRKHHVPAGESCRDWCKDPDQEEDLVSWLKDALASLSQL